MLIYNTTYQVDLADARNFVVYIHEKFIPSALVQGGLKNARLSRILSHKDNDSECFSLQFETEDSAAIHRWMVQKGNALNQELLNLFDNRVAGFSTLMEVIE